MYFPMVDILSIRLPGRYETLFFGIPKGTFYKKSPLAGFGAKAPKAGP